MTDNNSKMPFNFTEAGYDSPDEELLSKSIGVLREAVRTTQRYTESENDYIKSCPTYVIGYSPGRVQILRGHCLYSGYRDISSSLNVISIDDLPSYINSVLRSDQADLGASLYGYGASDLPTLINSILRAAQGDVSAEVNIISISNLPTSVNSILRNSLGNLTAFIDIAATSAQRDFPAYINSILRAGQGNLRGYIRNWQREYPIDFPAYIHRIELVDLGAIVDTHLPRDLMASAKAFDREYLDFPAFLRTNFASTGNLSAYLNEIRSADLGAIIGLIPAGNLSAYLKVWPQSYLTASTYGWQSSDLAAYLGFSYTRNLSGSINIVSDTFVDLVARIRGYVSDTLDLTAVIGAFHYGDLGAILRATYLSDLPSYLFAIKPKDLGADIHVWHERFLQGILNGIDYPWNLTASINVVGGKRSLAAYISALQGTAQPADLTARIWTWWPEYLTAQITGVNAHVLGAYINPLLAASDLHASIRPKMIRLTTILSVPTMAHKDLSAIINYPCFYTSYSTLSANIYAKYKGDLYAYIKALRFDYKPALLGAKIGYSNSYLEVDKLKIGINILPSEYQTQDKFRFLIHIFAAENNLTAAIRGTLRYTGLGASITGEDVESYTFDTNLQNRERVIHTTYDGVFKTFETVEMAFKSAVKDYYYSLDGDYTWKTDRFERWMLDVKSMLPANVALRLKRRLHRATVLYDLRKFASIDEALRYAIAYVTEYPQANLGATIINRGTYAQLSGSIIPRYIVSSNETLTSSIIPSGSTVVVGEANKISKI